MEKYLSFVTIDVWTLIFTWCNLLILFFAMKKFLFGPISNILKKRDEEINSMYKSAENAEKSAAAKELEYEKKLDAAGDTASSIIENASKSAQERSTEIINEAEQKAASLISRANKQIALDKAKAISDAKSDISSLAVDIAAKIIEKDINGSDHERLIDNMINEMGESL